MIPRFPSPLRAARQPPYYPSVTLVKLRGGAAHCRRWKTWGLGQGHQAQWKQEHHDENGGTVKQTSAQWAVRLPTVFRNWAPEVCQQRDWRILLWGTWPAQWERLKIPTSGFPQRNSLAVILSEADRPPAPHPQPTRKHPEPRFLVCSLWPHS